MGFGMVDSAVSLGGVIGRRTSGEKNIAGTSSASPSDTLIATAIWALKKLATMPTASPPTAATPMHWPSIPNAVPRISGSDDIRIMVLCMVLYPAAPSPANSNIRNDTGYQGDKAKNSRLSNCKASPRQKMRP